MTGFQLKLIAILTMAIDHIGYGLVPYLSYEDPDMAYLYPLCRGIGRLAFPIFCFLLVEGFVHTKNLARYMGRMALFALATEPFFDFFCTGTWFSMEGQNVLFTLLFGLLALASYNKKDWPFLLRLMGVAGAMALAHFAGSDYGFYGVLVIFLFYLCRDLGWGGKGLVAAANLYQNWAALGVLLTGFYNGQRGQEIKYFFYVFYPAHLLVIGLLSQYWFS